jgi:hypothetical protein
MKETKTEFEKCWDCGGDGGYSNHHNGGWETCYTCHGEKRFPMGTKKWSDKRKAELEKIRRILIEKVETEADKRIKAWEKKNPKPTGKVTIIYE